MLPGLHTYTQATYNSYNLFISIVRRIFYLATNSGKKKVWPQIRRLYRNTIIHIVAVFWLDYGLENIKLLQISTCMQPYSYDNAAQTLFLPTAQIGTFVAISK